MKRPLRAAAHGEAAAHGKLQRNKRLSLAVSICRCQAAMPRKGRRHPRSPPHSAPIRSSLEPRSRYSTRPLSILRTSAVSSALAAKLEARVFRAAVELGQRENSPIKPTGGAEPRVCVKASPLAAGTGDAGGSGGSSTPSTLRVTAGLASATVSTAESRL